MGNQISECSKLWEHTKNYYFLKFIPLFFNCHLTTVIQCRIAHNNNKNTYSTPYYFVQSCDLSLICKSSWKHYLGAKPCLLIERMIKKKCSTTLTCNLTKLLAFITKKKRRRNTYSCKKLFIVPSGLFNNYFKVNSVTSKDPLFRNGLSRSVKPWQPLELQLGRKENHHLIQQCQNGSSEWVWWSQYHATNDKLNISCFSYGYCPSGLFF